MAKQKVVVKVSLNNQKACTKAISTVAGIDGVIETELLKENNQISVTGNNMDVFLVVTKLRKAMKHAVVETVSVIEENNQENKPAYGPPMTYFYNPQIPQPGWVDYDHHSNHANNDQSCSIL